MRWVRRYSALGEHGLAWLGLGLLGAALDRPARSRWIRATAVVGCAYLTSSSIKWSIGRARPVVEDLPHLMATPTGLSFPSSHSTSSFAAARAFTGLLPAGPLYCAATAMALSRLYLGVHYPSDVLGGIIVGLAWAAFCMATLEASLVIGRRRAPKEVHEVPSPKEVEDAHAPKQEVAAV